MKKKIIISILIIGLIVVAGALSVSASNPTDILKSDNVNGIEVKDGKLYSTNKAHTEIGTVKMINSVDEGEKEIFANDLEGFEIPTNVAVLKQLINQLPAGVSKQTGALIIKQTMEALGISMKSVLQEAQQVQESLNNSQRECQASIMEYRKQINVLEKQSQKYQRQYSALNDIISLFIQTSI